MKYQQKLKFWQKNISNEKQLKIMTKKQKITTYENKGKHLNLKEMYPGPGGTDLLRDRFRGRNTGKCSLVLLRDRL